MRNRGCGQSIRLCFFFSFLFIFFPCSSTFHRMLSFSDWSEELLRYGSITWGPFFRNGLLHRGSPTGCNSWHTTFSCMGPAWARVSFRPHPLAMVWGPLWVAVLVSAPSWSYMGIRETTCITMISVDCRGTSASALGGPIFLSSDFSIWSVVSPTFFSLLSQSCCGEFFCPLLNILSQRHKQHHWCIHLWSALSLFWSMLGLPQGSSWFLLTEATPVVALLPKHWNLNPKHINCPH